MSHISCTCNPPAVISTIIGERCHIINERGEWCAIINEKGTYLQTLVIPSSEEIIKEQNIQEARLLEQSDQIAKENRIQELKNKLQNNEQLTLQELTELLKLTI
jgi:hypothetical protein